MKLYVNGTPMTKAEVNRNKLFRAVIISLFTWHRADETDDTETKWGWWGDTLADVEGDQIGSKLYLCLRDKLTDETILKAQEYAEQSLQWMIDDGIVTSISVHAERSSSDVNRLDMIVTFTADQDYQIDFKELNNVE